MKILITNWKKGWKFWSVRLQAIGLGLIFYLVEYPEHAIAIWISLPADLKAVFPQEFVRYIGYSIAGAAIIARFIKQPKLDQPGRLQESNGAVRR